MRAVEVREFGGLEQLRWDDVPMPAPGAGEAVVKIHASGAPLARDTTAGPGQ